MFPRIRKLWKRLPGGLRKRLWGALNWTGLPYSLAYLASYDDRHAVRNFAGNLDFVKAEYLRSSGDQKEHLAQQLDAILENLVMRNGVRKTTYSMRHKRTLATFLADERCRLQKPAIRVLDVPSSTGIACLDSLEMLGQYYRISAYVLGDLFFQIYYDRDRECIFDEELNLLQVKGKKRFFSIYRGGNSGYECTSLTNALLFPVTLVSWYLKKKYVYSETSSSVPILVIHPDVEARLGNGVLRTRKVDVFKDIGEKYDLILSFNLLLRKYFPEKQIAKGIETLKNALGEHGFLVMGDTESFSVAQKTAGKLVVVREEGRF